MLLYYHTVALSCITSSILDNKNNSVVAAGKWNSVGLRKSLKSCKQVNMELHLSFILAVLTAC